ncbi:isoprenyl transferase [Liquorilactobacillus capillatus]|uniref:Isoprenyl transferase n=1 Tax=Liquorilactobacillus capillatus DSM 19910 TaxID=1423731 RepID=A0A0R1M888_9LACO|nr:isoprenyl transferase [Liquorilactobacillus capillatus]KRL01301.1 di-trans,poly-cis-decaprenylcistransferase [Liquorilactobacillus capillatus DSM 19910]
MFSRLNKNNGSSQNENDKIDLERIPTHIAIIMDGNGRWAQKRHLPRIAGHKAALETVKEVTREASSLGVKVLTLYTFSTENWKRPQKEVDFLMGLPITFFDTFVPELVEKNIRVNTIGYIDELPAKTQAAVGRAVEKTAQNDGMVLNFAINYGGRAEITTMVKKIAQQVKDGQLAVDEINDEKITETLMTSSVAPYNDPELLIRTSGEIRLSNFLLWQLAYSEFVFSDVLWPDYTAKSLRTDIHEYQSRNRRFGGLKKE